MGLHNFYKQFCTETFDEKGALLSFEPIVPENFNFAYDVVDKIAELEPDRKALVWCNTKGEERRFTFADMRDASNRAANLFANAGVKKGDMVMLVLKRHYQFWIAVLALHKLGAVAVPASNLLTAKDYVYRFGAAGIRHIVATAEGEVTEQIEQAIAVYEGTMESQFIVRGSRSGWTDFDAALAQESPVFSRVPTCSEDAILLYFTSGTTGMPKMVYHVHDYPIAHIVTAVHWHNVDPDGLHLTVSDTGWMKAMWGKMYGQWLAGTAVFVYDFDKFVPSELLDVIKKYQVTTFCAPPTIYRFLIKQDMDSDSFATVKYATTAGEALNPEVFYRFRDLTGLELKEAFGQTETTILTYNMKGAIPKVGSMGKPSPLYDVCLVDENGEAVPPGEVGEVVVRIPEGKTQVGVYRGYYQDPELTKSVWYDGFYHTGDTAWKDEDGFFWYVGRIDDIIKASGYRIGPFEIESVLMEHPSVLECAVTGAPDPVRGTVVKATIVLSHSYTACEKLKQELQNYVKKQTAPYKYPRIVEFVSELPKTISGKIRRAIIRKGVME